jgi:MerR family Zn(II)-responsive transcriptional regulator of zntA
MLTIGRLAREARLSTDSIRFYERQGLVSPTSRTDAGYRLYTDETVRRLLFIKHAQRCGFSLADIRELLRPEETVTGRRSVQTKAIEKRAEVERTITELQTMSRALSRLISEQESPAEPFPAAAPPLLAAFEATLPTAA